MSKYFHSNLKYLRSKNGVRQLDLAHMLGLKSESAVSEWEKGIRIPSAGTLSDMANIFNVSIDSLMNVNLESTNIRTIKSIPILGSIAAGIPILAEENIEDYFSIDGRIKADFALNIKGDSMVNAGINEGDMVFIHQTQNLENGEIGAILVEGEATLKKFYKNEDSIVLQSENNKYPPMVFTGGDIKILGKLSAVLNISK